MRVIDAAAISEAATVLGAEVCALRDFVAGDSAPEDWLMLEGIDPAGLQTVIDAVEDQARELVRRGSKAHRIAGTSFATGFMAGYIVARDRALLEEAA